MLPMFVFLGAFGKLGLLGVAVGALVWWLGYKLWDKFGSTGRWMLSLTGLVIVFSVFVAANELKSEARHNKTSSVITPPATGRSLDDIYYGRSANPQSQFTKPPPGYVLENSMGWTEKETGRDLINPFTNPFQEAPAGTRYYRDSKNQVVLVYPPGTRPNLPPANPLGLNNSIALSN